jgi:DNA-binding IclR family transcriptional regulator
MTTVRQTRKAADDNTPSGVLSKAVGLLDLMATAGELTPAQLAEQSGEPRSSVYRLLSSLQELGLVDRGPRRGTYVLGPKLLRLGNAVASRLDERRAALPVMERIHAELGETTFLCVRRRLDAVCIARIDGTRVNLLAMSLGGSLPLHTGAAPRALLAFEPEERWEEYLDAAELVRFTEHSPVDRAEVLAELRRTRERGYAISDQDVTRGVGSVGAPIFDHSGVVRAAVSVGGMRASILDPASDATALVCAGAMEISRYLGYEGSPGGSE